MKKSTMRVLLVVMSVVFVIGLIAFITGMVAVNNDKVTEVFGPKVNTANLYNTDNMTIYDQNKGNGVIVDVDEKTGAITLDGTATEDITIEVGKVTLKEGVYTITAFKNAAYSYCYVTASTDTTVYNFDFTPGNVIEVADGEVTVTIEINILEGAEFDNTEILPVIVSGTTAGSFYK